MTTQPVRRRSVAWRYNALRWLLVRLLRLANWWCINFDNAVESARKDVR